MVETDRSRPPRMNICICRQKGGRKDIARKMIEVLVFTINSDNSFGPHNCAGGQSRYWRLLSRRQTRTWLIICRT